MTNVYYFTAAWCNPCRMFKPIVEQAAQETGKHITFVDVDQAPDMTQQYGIKSVPTIIVVNEIGQVVNRMTGAQSKSTITNLLSIC